MGLTCLRLRKEWVCKEDLVKILSQRASKCVRAGKLRLESLVLEEMFCVRKGSSGTPFIFSSQRLQRLQKLLRSTPISRLTMVEPTMAPSPENHRSKPEKEMVDHSPLVTIFLAGTIFS